MKVEYKDFCIIDNDDKGCYKIVTENGIESFKKVEEFSMLVHHKGKVFPLYVKNNVFETPENVSFHQVDSEMNKNETSLSDYMEHFWKNKFSCWKEHDSNPKMEVINLKFKDFEILEYGDDSYKYGGCETCDYGTHYIKTVCLKIVVEGKEKEVFAQNHSMKEIPEMSVGKLILFFCNLNKETTYLEFIKRFEKHFNSEHIYIEIR